jgi:hypothetical protein
MPRDIVICCDGTGNEYGSSNSNVVKLYWALPLVAGSTVAYYHPGVGTMGARNALTAIGKFWTKVRGLAFGYGVSDNIADAYTFLMNEFQPGDRIFIFGFSRGAYTARALCGMLTMFGLLRPGNEGLIPYAMRLFKSGSEDRFDIAKGFRGTFSVDCEPYFLGLWDTVSSVGWILDPIGLRPGSMPYTTKFPDVQFIRHAISIDERRAFFRQNRVHGPAFPTQDIKEVWFAGVHSDVGGSYCEAESGLSKIALRWMFCEAQSAGLPIDAQKLVEMLGGDSCHVAPNPAARLHKSLHGFWWIGEFWPKHHVNAVAVPGQGEPKYVPGIRFNLGRRRVIPEGVRIHQTVFERMKQVQAYRPPNLPQQYTVEPETSCELAPRTQVPSGLPPCEKTGVLQALLKNKLAAALTMLVVLAACALVVTAFALHNSLEVPAIKRPKEVVWLWQNWTDDQRHIYYHTAQGSNLLPYAWFLALEQPRISLKGAPPFRDNSYLQGFGFIPDNSYELNPDALPIGFARDDRFVDPYSGQKQVVLGLTCAGCHTGELFYKGKAIRIDAGPAMIDLQKFTEALGLAVTWTYYDPPRFHRFARRVLGPNSTHADRAGLRRSLKYYLDSSFAEVKSTLPLFPTPEGYGRTDALARIGNFVFGTELNNKKNLVVGDAPVNYPPIWDASWMDWVQYNGSIQQPMGRNVGEALGVRSRINLLGYPGAQFQNTVHVDNIHQLETVLGGANPGDGVRSPKWPADVFGKIDDATADKGEKLYKELCIHCHQAPMNSPEGLKPEHWTSKTGAGGKQFFKVNMIPIAEIGTDPGEAENFNKRMADTGPLGQGKLSASEGMKYITEKLITQAYDDLKLTPEERLEWNGYRENEVLAPLKYKARPHNGIWATPPYLHNGSVPNLFELLSPVAERSRVFYLGSKEYDPVKLGLNTDFMKGTSKLDVAQKGNSNAGHEFNDGAIGNGIIGRKLTVEERMQIIEYLKRL